MTLTQYRGVARTRIAFVSDRDATKERRSKELYIVDYDGFNPRRVTVNGSLNILPAWRPDGAALAYVSYRQGSPLLYLARIFEGQSVSEPDRREGGRPGLRPDLQPRREEHRVREHPRGEHGRLGGERRRQRRPAPDHDPGLGHRALLEPDRPGDRVHLEPHRHAADLGDGQRGPERAPPRPSATTTTAAPGTPRRSTARSPTPPASRREASTSPSSTWPPGRSGRSPRAGARASTRPGPPTGATSSSRASAPSAGRSRSPTGRAAASRPSPPAPATTCSRTGARERGPVPRRVPCRCAPIADSPASSWPWPCSLAACRLREEAPARARLDPGRRGVGGRDRARGPHRRPAPGRGPDVQAVEGEGASGTDLAAGCRSGSSEGGPLADIHFELDSATLTDEARATLEKHALWLQGTGATSGSRSRATATSAAPSSTTSPSASSGRARCATTSRASGWPPTACASSRSARSARSTRPRPRGLREEPPRALHRVPRSAGPTAGPLRYDRWLVTRALRRRP